MTRDDRISKELRGYNEPPELTREQLDTMWGAVEEQAFPRRFASPSGESDTAGRRPWSRRGPFEVARRLMPLAATLLLGVLIGRFAVPAPEPATVVTASRSAADSASMPEPYQSTTSRYLGQTAALLVALPAEVRAGRADAPYLGRAHDLLLTTRLLLDSPASADPKMRSLLEDLELVLAQVVRLQSAESAAELELIRQALEQRDVLPRLRTAVADIFADD